MIFRFFVSSEVYTRFVSGSKLDQSNSGQGLFDVCLKYTIPLMALFSSSQGAFPKV